MNYDLTILEEGCKEYGIQLNEEQKKQFVQYYELLVEWNKVMNLTGITDFEEVLLKHFVDSLSIVKGMDMSKISTCIDVGTGAGFPGIPLKIAFPHLQITLLDSLNKRLNFLNEVIEQLGLTGIQTVHGRAEDAARKAEYREAKKAISVLGGKLEKEVDFKLYKTDMDRTLVVIKKVKGTPKKYPRKAGTPTKEPII